MKLSVRRAPFDVVEGEGMRVGKGRAGVVGGVKALEASAR